MALKTILVHADHTEAAAGRLAAAARLAERHDAHLVGLAVNPPLNLPVYAEAPLPGDLIRSLEERRNTDVAAAARHFDTAVKAAGRDGRSEWRTAEGDPIDALALHARYADLTVVGQPDRDSAGAEFVDLPHHLVLEAGRPLLLIPVGGAAKPIGETVVVAWNASREAARAVADAMPILEKARKVQVVAVDPKRMGDAPGADIAAHLARHGVTVEVIRAAAADADVGEVLLNHVADAGADLLVMGAYGHSRFRQMILGGVSRHIIENMTVPVLMSH